MVPKERGTRRAWAGLDDWRIMPPMGLTAGLGRSSNAVLARVGGLDWTAIQRSTAWVVPAGFVLMTVEVISKYIETPTWLGFDARLYAAASGAWLGGSNPWAVSDVGIYYAAPPPTLLAFVPFYWMPPILVSAVWVLGSFVLAALAIRSLRLPIWWMAFPPIVDGALVGNPDVAVLALLVVAGGRFGAVAPFLKIYAVVPMIGERQWRQMITTLGLLAVTAVVLPWGSWFSQLATIAENLAAVSIRQNTSVYGSPVLMAIAVIALLALGRRRAGWLAVPLLWPSTQIHYMAISVPGLTPYLALAWCFPVPEVRVASTCLFVLYEYVVGKQHPAFGVGKGILEGRNVSQPG